MIIDINNLYHLPFWKDENRPIFPVNPKTENPQVTRLKKFHVKTGMKDIFLKQLPLFCELSL